MWSENLINKCSCFHRYSQRQHCSQTKRPAVRCAWLLPQHLPALHLPPVKAGKPPPWSHMSLGDVKQCHSSSSPQGREGVFWGCNWMIWARSTATLAFQSGSASSASEKRARGDRMAIRAAGGLQHAGWLFFDQRKCPAITATAAWFYGVLHWGKECLLSSVWKASIITMRFNFCVHGSVAGNACLWQCRSEQSLAYLCPL